MTRRKDNEEVLFLKKHYSFDRWTSKRIYDQNLYIWKFYLFGNELPDWVSHSVRSFSSKDWPPHVKSIWRKPKDNKTLLRVDILECNSLNATHSFLLNFLGEFQAPILKYQELEDEGIGDVSFIAPKGTSIVFARANLICHIACVGRNLISVRNDAQLLDEQFTSMPIQEKNDVNPKILLFEVPKDLDISVTQEIPLELEAKDPLERQIWFKFFSRTGEVTTRNEKELIYIPISTGLQEITVYAINPNRGVSKSKLNFSVE